MAARHAARAGAVLTLVAASLVAVGPAQAEDCVEHRVSDNKRAVVVTNTCTESRRIKVVWGKATDSACIQLRAYDGEHIDSRGWPAGFDRIASC